MPDPGLALIGLMEAPLALGFLQQACLPAAADPEALQAEWTAAQAKLAGQPIPNAGHPELLPIPPEHAPYLQKVAAHPRLVNGLDSMPFEFKMAEIDPLLAYQFSVNVSRTQALCAQLGEPPTVESMLPVFLPLQAEDLAIVRQQQSTSLVFMADGANLRILSHGQIGLDPNLQAGFYGIALGPSGPWVHVVRFEGRCYLRNGYHRVYGAKRAGASHIPCMVIEAPTWELVGAAGGGGTFDRPLLESADPPTMAHYTEARAWPVQLRRQTRVVQVSWAEYLLPEQPPTGPAPPV